MASARDGSPASCGNTVTAELHGKSGEKSAITTTSLGRLTKHLLCKALQAKQGKEPSLCIQILCQLAKYILYLSKV